MALLSARNLLNQKLLTRLNNKPFTNICYIPIVITSELDREGNNILKRHGVYQELVNDRLFGHSGLPSSKHLSKHLRRRWDYQAATWSKLTKANILCEFSNVMAASYQGSQDSSVRKGASKQLQITGV